jgi:rhodanese-related sulfurtransferase
MTCEALKHLMDTKKSDHYTLLDVRTSEEFAIAHIEGSINIPLTDLALNLSKIPDNEIVVICHHGIRSFHAAMFLLKEEYGRCYNLKGGVDAWAQSIDTTMTRY